MKTTKTHLSDLTQLLINRLRTNVLNDEARLTEVAALEIDELHGQRKDFDLTHLSSLLKAYEIDDVQVNINTFSWISSDQSILLLWYSVLFSKIFDAGASNPAAYGQHFPQDKNTIDALSFITTLFASILALDHFHGITRLDQQTLHLVIKTTMAWHTSLEADPDNEHLQIDNILRLAGSLFYSALQTVDSFKQIH